MHAETVALFATWLAILMSGHTIADHILQTDAMAANKAAPSREAVAAGTSPRHGWAACLAHVTSYHIGLAVWAGLFCTILGITPTLWGVATALAWSYATHAFLDRRWPVAWLLRHTGSPNFAELKTGGLNGMYLADQALHHAALALAALLLTRL